MIRYSIKTLYHFSCGHCGKWWSPMLHQSHDKQELTCPHCGTKGELAPAEPLETTEDPLVEAVLEFLNEQALEAPSYLEKHLKRDVK